MMNYVHKFLSRKNVYGFVLIIGTILVFVYGMFPNQRGIVYNIIFNPFWPAILGIFEIYLQTIEKEIAKENERKIGALSGVLRGRLENKKERELIKSIMDAVSEKDLMACNANKIVEMELEEKLSKAGEVGGTSQGVNPN